jgi:hypothetical protein
LSFPRWCFSPRRLHCRETKRSFEIGPGGFGSCTLCRMSQRKKPSHQKEDAKLFDNSLPEFCTYVKSRDHRAGVPDQQIFIKFNNDVVQLQKAEKKLN